jgi:hypothetical protein
MNADQRLAEWLPEDPTLQENPDPGSEAPDPTHVSPRVSSSARGLRARPPAREPAPPQRAVALQRTRRIPAAFGMVGPETRIVEFAGELGRRIRREPLKALAVAVGAGFVIGGAMSFRAGRLLLAAAARHVTRELLKQLL